MSCDAVIFDLFGTLVPSLPPDAYEVSLCVTAYAAGADIDAFLARWSDEEFIRQRSTGHFESQAACIEHVCRQLGHSPDRQALSDAAAVRAEFVRACLDPRVGAAEVVSQIKQQGLKLGLMSVCSRDTPAAWAQMPLADHFDAALFSCELGLTKPDPRFYALTCERLSVRPEQCLYVGDGFGSELTGARTAGMEAVLICPPDEADIILARDETRNWDGPRIESLSEVLALL